MNIHTMNAPLFLGLAMAASTAGTTSAQSVCEQLTIERIGYAPFGGGMEVLLHNGSDEFLNYPTIHLLTTAGDTIGYSIMHFFGMTAGGSLLYRTEDIGPPPSSPLSGTLLFNYVDFEGNTIVSCTLPLTNIDLCPVAACSPVQVVTYFGTSTPEAELDWLISTADGEVVGQGSLSVDPDGSGTDMDEICLPPGHYTLSVLQSSGEPGSFTMGLITAEASLMEGLSDALPPGEPLDLPFAFYAPCIAIGQQVVAPVRPSARIAVVDQQLHISTQDGLPIGPVYLLDALGRTVRHMPASGVPSAVIDLSGLPSATYIVQSGSHRWPAQRFILP